MLNKSQVWVTVACFLPGQAKDLSAPPHICTQSFPTLLNRLSWRWKRYVTPTQHLSTRL